jgi:ABC-type transport system involved in multi-copper enzyme maturation permease subunit
LNSRKNWFVVILLFGLLLTFGFSNMAAFDEIRQDEAIRFEQLSNENAQWARHNWNYSAYSGRVYDPTSPRDMRFGRRRVEYMAQYSNIVFRHHDRAQVYAQNLSDAIWENNRRAELEYITNIHASLMTTYMRLFENGDFNQVSAHHFENGISVFFENRIDFHRSYYEFFRHFVDNDIHFSYESEMTGFNFVYQIMRQLLPLIILVIVFMAIGDVFTSDNNSGSYKFLLLNPISRTKVFLAKIASAFSIAFVMIFVPLILSGIIMGAINGAGSANYPIMVQGDAFSSFVPLPNNLATDTRTGYVTGETFFGTFRFRLGSFNFTGAGYIPENPALGLTRFSSHAPYANFFTPHENLTFTPMLSIMLMTLPLYALLILTAVAFLALMSVISQRSLPTIIICLLIGMGALAFPSPEADLSLLARLNPFAYINPVNILNGLGSTTMLTGIVVLAGISAIFLTAGILIFRRQDIRC